MGGGVWGFTLTGASHLEKISMLTMTMTMKIFYLSIIYKFI